jgi:hypothetical protein
MIKWFFILISIFFVKQSYNQIVFNNVYNDYDDTVYQNQYNVEAFYDILLTNTGNIITLGSTQREDSAYIYIYIVESDEFGEVLKKKKVSISPFSENSGGDAIQILDSSIYVVGYTTDNLYTQGQNPKGLMVKFDKNLNLLWYKTNYDIGDRNRFQKVIFNEVENAFYVLSFAHSDTVNQEFDIFLSKIDTSGNMLNTWQFGGNDWEYCNDFKQLENGTFILSGLTYTNATGTLGRPDIYILNVDTFGNILWEKRYGYPGYDQTKGRQNLYVGEDFMIVVGTHEQMNGNDVAWLLKMDMQGDTIWTKMYDNGNSFETFYGIEKWNESSFLILGGTRDYSFTQDTKPVTWLLRIDTLGEIIWERSINKYADEVNADTYPYDFEIAPDRGILLAGYVINNSFQENGIYHRNDAWLAKTDSCGYTVGDIPTAFFVIDSILKTKENNKVFITTDSKNYCSAEMDWGDGSENTFFYAYANNLPPVEKQFEHTFSENGTYTIKTTTLAGEEFRTYEVDIVINGISVGVEDVTAEAINISLFPNPANDYIIVQNPSSVSNKPSKFPSTEGLGVCCSEFKAIIYSLNGKELKNFNLNTKLYQQKIDVSNISNGVYFVTFTINGIQAGTEKMVIAK